MKRLFLTLVAVLVLAPLLAGGSCATSGGSKDTALPNLPQVVTKVIETPKPLPGWITIELVLPKRESGTVEAYKVNERAWQAFGELANCHRRLSDKIARGEYADLAICGDVKP